MCRVVTVNLRLPNGVADSPQTGYGEEYMRCVRMRSPVHQDADNNRVNQEAQEHERESARILHERAEEQRAYRVHHAETDHHVADAGDAQCARDVSLPTKKNTKNVQSIDRK